MYLGWSGFDSVNLHMTIPSATRHNRRIPSFYDRLIERGKAKKKALVAWMQKLLAIKNTLM
jgi:transposase